MLAVLGFKIACWLSYYSPAWLRITFATIAGEIYYWVARSHSRYSDRNIQIVLGEPRINRRVRLVSRRCFRNYSKYMTEFFMVYNLKPEDLLKVTGTAGWEHIDEALERGKGVMLVTPHFGNWDFAATIVANQGYKLTSVANDFNPPELNELIQGNRRKQGMTIYSPKEALRGLFTTLKNNQIVVLLLDSPLQNDISDSIVVNFFGRPARFPVGPARLVNRTGATMVFGYIVRQPGNKFYYGMWEPPLYYEPKGERDEDLRAITQSFANEIEKLVRRHPDQWYMFRKLWLEDDEIAEYEQQQHEQVGRKKTRSTRNVEVG